MGVCKNSAKSVPAVVAKREVSRSTVSAASRAISSVHSTGSIVPSERRSLTELFENATVIHSYSRKDMINDGYLIEVPEEIARQAGFKVPIGILLEPWELCVAWSDEDSKRQTHQDKTARLWDLLSVLRVAAKTQGGDTVHFSVARIPRDEKSKRPELAALKAVIGPGDDPKPVITVMLPGQD